MSDHIYKIIELVGSSETSIEDAIQTAVASTATRTDSAPPIRVARTM